MGWQSPGADTFDAVEAMRERLRQEKRQAMLDELTRQSKKIDMITSMENAQTNREYRKSLEEARAEEAFGRKLKNSGLAPDMSIEGLDPAFVSELEKRGFIGSRPPANQIDVDHWLGPDASALPSVQDEKFFKGDSGYQQSRQRAKAIGDLFKQPGISDLPAESIAAKLMEIFPDDDLARTLIQNMLINERLPEQDMFRRNRDTGVLELDIDPRTGNPMKGRGRSPIISDWNPPDPRAVTAPTAQYSFTDPKDGTPITFTNRLDADGKPVYLRVDGTRYLGPVAPKPSPPRAAGPAQARKNKISDTLKNAYKKDMVAIFGQDPNAWIFNRMNPKQRAAAEQAAKNIYASFSQDVVRVAKAIRASNMPIEEAMGKVQFDDAKKADLFELLTVLAKVE